MSVLISRRKQRPSSASAALQSHNNYQQITIDDMRPATSISTSRSHRSYNRNYQSPVTSKTRTQHNNAINGWTSIAPLETNSRAQQRRVTLSTLHDVSKSTATISRPRSAASSKIKLEEYINLDHLHILKSAFDANATKGRILTKKEFISIFGSLAGLQGNNNEQIELLFMKIDSCCNDYISWNEFCTYMQLEYAEKEDAYLHGKEVAFSVPAITSSTPHREQFLRILNTSDNNFVIMSQDGMITFWGPDLKLKRSRQITHDVTKSKSKWITDFTLMPQYNKIVTATGDREIQFYEMSTFEAYCQISGLDSVPLKIDYWGSRSSDACYVLYGDVQGCINVIQIASAGETLRTWKKSPKSDGIASVNLEREVARSSNIRFTRWKVHNDWVGQLNYYESIQSVISCSNDDTNALVIGSLQSSTKVDSQLREVYFSVNNRPRPQQSNYIMGSQPKRRSDSDQTVFKIYKGVKTFDFSKQKNLIVTGGMDRIIRTWNPYVANKPTGMLRGHNAPINYLKISSDEGRVFSVSTDKTIRIWDLQDHTCLHIVRPKAHKIRGDIQVAHYNAQNRTIAIATDLLASMTLKCKTVVVDMATSHKEAITAIKYNSSFKQIVTASDGSVVRVWDIETGNLLFEFTQAHGTSAITAIMFDSSGRRLITGGRDGCLRIWNYNNGHCLRILKKDGRNQEISDIAYYTQNKNKHIVCVGWDKRINIYNDNPGDFRYVQPPMPYWADDTLNGHRDDILSVTACSPNLLATSSYNGKVIVWNLVSGHVFCRLQVPCKDSQYKSGEQNAISKIAFLAARVNDKLSAMLISNGPNGFIYFWNIYNGGSIYASFKATDFDEIVAIAANSENTKLFTADIKGFVGVWDITTYAAGGKEYMPPDVLCSWRAHTQNITSIDLIEYQDAIATASTDCTMRLWTYEGKYIGTFGQQESWDIYDSTTYQSPMVPYDVLVDPQSLPNHPVLNEKKDMIEIAHKNSIAEAEKKKLEANSDSQFQQPPAQWYKNVKHNAKFDDLDITSEVLKERLTGSGKRLRHEILTPLLRSRSGIAREYQSLQCYDLQDTPSIPEPQKLTTNNDPFESIFS